MQAELRMLATLGVVVLAGCTSVQSGRLISEDHIGAIERGETTKPEIRRWFGAPTSRTIHAGGRDVWVYESVRTEGHDTRKLTQFACWLGALARVPCSVGAPINIREETRTRQVLKVYFASSGIVDDFSYTLEQKPTRVVY